MGILNKLKAKETNDGHNDSYLDTDFDPAENLSSSNLN